MGLKVTISNRPNRYSRVIRVESPDPSGTAWPIYSETEVDDRMLELSSIRFDHLIDDAVRKHCRQVADAMFRDWKEGR